MINGENYLDTNLVDNLENVEAYSVARTEDKEESTKKDLRDLEDIEAYSVLYTKESIIACSVSRAEEEEDSFEDIVGKDSTKDIVLCAEDNIAIEIENLSKDIETDNAWYTEDKDILYAEDNIV